MESNVEISNMITPFINVLKALSDEWKHFTESGLSDYLRIQTEKYYLTNNFLHPIEKVKFIDNYFPLKATYEAFSTNFNNAGEVISNYKNITLVGYAGSGKTTLLRHIFFQTIFQKKKIPIVIELRHLNDYKGTFEDMLVEKVTKVRLEPSTDIFKRTLINGNYIFLLDGFDEIFSSRKSEINRQLELFIDAYSENNFVITTRPGSGIERSARFFDFRVNDLDDIDIVKFVNKLVYPKERIGNILSVINDRRNNNYKHYLKNPLLLSMFILAFRSHPEIPKRKSAFYSNVFDTLYSRHDGINKNSYPREKLSRLEKEDFEKVISVFSYISLTQHQLTFTEEYLTATLIVCKKATELAFDIESIIFDLKTSISIIHQDGFEYTFPHRSLQEYFAARFISSLPDNNKKSAYRKIIDSFSNDSNDDGENFFRLCIELDRISFIDKIVISELQKTTNMLRKKSGRDLYREFTKQLLLVMSVGISYEDLIGKDIFTVDIQGMQVNIELSIFGKNVFTNIISIFDIYDLGNFSRFPKDSGSRDQILIMLYNKCLVSFNEVSSQAIFDNRALADEIFLENGFLQLIDDLLDAVTQKIINFQEEIANKKQSINDILNFED